MAADYPKSAVEDRLCKQAKWCHKLGSPLYATLLERAAADVEEGGPCWSVLEGHESDPRASALALRLMGAVHGLVLEGRAPVLARYYPSVGGDPRREGLWLAFRSTLEEHRETLRILIQRPVQTNEVGRCAALLGGFLLLTKWTGLPLRLLEIGASAGLNLLWDHYHYEDGNATWGDPGSPVRIPVIFTGGRPPFEVRPCVVERRGCDIRPVDPRSAEGRLTLLSYVWADQQHRIELLRCALEAAKNVLCVVDAGDAAEWLPRNLQVDRRGVATVIFHSITWQYLSETGRARVRETLQEAGSRANVGGPLAWLFMEPGQNQADIRLTLWPGGAERFIATAGFHGSPVNWLGA